MSRERPAQFPQRCGGPPPPPPGSPRSRTGGTAGDVDPTTPPAHRALGVAVGHRQRPHAVPTPGDGAAPRAGHRGQVAAAGHLNQDRGRPGRARPVRRAEPRTAAVRCAPPGRVPRRTRRPRAQRPALARTTGRGATRSCAQPLPTRAWASAVRARNRRRSPRSAAGGHAACRPRAGVRIGRARLGQRVVAVVPHNHQAQPVDRGEHRTAGPDHQPRLAA